MLIYSLSPVALRDGVLNLERLGWTVSTKMNVIPEDDSPQVPKVSVTLGNSWKWYSRTMSLLW